MKRNEQKKYHFIYKVVRDFDQKYYLGMHSTDNLDDGYLGSGTLLWHSIKKHGRECHHLYIVEFLPDRRSLSAREKQVVNEEVVNDPMSFNLRVGGNGGDVTYSSGPLTEEHKQKVSAALKGKKKPEGFGKKISIALTGKKLSEEHKAACSASHLGKKLSEDHKKAQGLGRRGKPISEETKRKLSEHMKGKPNMSAAKLQKPCTVDGIKIYPSVSALVAELGHGKNGVKSPNMRFV